MKSFCIRAVASGALAIGALVFVWLGGADASSQASCARAGGYVVQFCVNYPSGEAVRDDTTMTLKVGATTTINRLVDAGAEETFDGTSDTAPLAADSTEGIVDQPIPNAAAADKPIVTLPPRTPLLPRSHPRSFWTYDTLVEYASSIAAEQEALNQSLAALTARAVLIRTDLMDDVPMTTVRSELMQDAAARDQLLASGAYSGAPAPWRLPLVGEITQDFGPSSLRLEPPMEYQGTFYKHFHAGTDIAAPWGAPIYAPAGGTVVFAGPMGDGAVVVMIAHDSGLVSLYAHLDGRVSPPQAKAGDTVQVGDRIGTVGLTGITTGPHLHWSVWRSGEPIDPLSLIGE